MLVSWLQNREVANPVRDGFESEVLWERYRLSAGDWRYPVPSTIVTVGVLCLCALAAVLAASTLRLGMPRGLIGRLPGDDRARFRRAWRAAYWRAHGGTMRLAPACFVIGVLATVFGLAVDQAWRAGAFEFTRRTYRGGPFPMSFQPTPVLGWLTWSVLAWFAVAMTGTAWWSYTRPARRAVLLSGVLGGRWCAVCGYRIGVRSRDGKENAACCPECGNAPRDVRRSRVDRGMQAR